MFGVSRDGAQRLCSGPEQNVVGLLLVLIGNCSNRLRDGKYYVEVFGVIEELRLAILEPLGTSKGLALGAVAISAGVIRDPLVSAVIALLDVAAERRCSTQFNGTHDATLFGR